MSLRMPSAVRSVLPKSERASTTPGTASVGRRPAHWRNFLISHRVQSADGDDSVEFSPDGGDSGQLQSPLRDSMIFSDEPVLLPNCSWLFEVVVVLLTLTPNAPPLALMAFDAS